jgi:hypothetical protein
MFGMAVPGNAYLPIGVILPAHEEAPLRTMILLVLLTTLSTGLLTWLL